MKIAVVYMPCNSRLKLKDIRILRQGCQIGEVVKNRLEPHQHFYVSNAYGAGMKQCYEMDDAQCLSFLQGQQLPIAGYKGYTQMLWKGYALGFAKGGWDGFKKQVSQGTADSLKQNCIRYHEFRRKQRLFLSKSYSNPFFRGIFRISTIL